MSYDINYDNFVRTTRVDESIVQPDPEVIVPGFSYLMPIFAGKGLDNKIQRFTGVGAFDHEFGSDTDRVNKYGHAGIIARHVIQGGGKLDVCRLMPSDAAKASVVVQLNVSSVDVDIPQYERDSFGKFVRDVDGNRVPLTEDDGSGTMIPVTKAGREIFISTKQYDNSVSERVNFTPSTEGSYSVYPLFSLNHIGRGKCGNAIGFKLGLDPERDPDSVDGRRYKLELFEKLDNGSVVVRGSSFESITFSFNPDSEFIPGLGKLDTLEANFKEYDDKYNLPITQRVSEENYEEVIELLSNYIPLEGGVDIDIITGIDKNGSEYDRVVVKEDGEDVSNVVTYLAGGSDGSLDATGLVASSQAAYDAAVDAGAVDLPTVITLEEAKTTVENTKTNLLKSFYLGEIDRDLFDHRIIDAGVTFDAWFPMEVKEVMAGRFCTEVRDDIAVYLDTGEESDTLEEAQAMAQAIKAKTGAHWGQVVVNIHNGRTTDRVKNIRTSGNYEIAYSLPYLYRARRPFTVHAGYSNGVVRTMDFDFTPKIVKDMLEIDPLMKNSLLFAMRLDRSDDRYWMSDDNSYSQKFSVFGSIRNVIFTGEVIRTLRKELIKHSFHPDNAAGAMVSADEALKDIFSNPYYPEFMVINYNIFQTRNDVLNQDCSIDLSIDFPNTQRGWKGTIRGRRTELPQ